MTTLPNLFAFPSADAAEPHRRVPRGLWGGAPAPTWEGSQPSATTERPVWSTHAPAAQYWTEHHAPRATEPAYAPRATEPAYAPRATERRASWVLPERSPACCVSMEDAPRGLLDLARLGFKVQGCDNNTYHPHGTLRFPVSGGVVPVDVYQRNGGKCVPHPLVQSVFTSTTS